MMPADPFHRSSEENRKVEMALEENDAQTLSQACQFSMYYLTRKMPKSTFVKPTGFSRMEASRTSKCGRDIGQIAAVDVESWMGIG